MVPELPPIGLQDLRTRISEQASRSYAASAELHLLVAEMVRREGWGESGILTPEHWLQFRAGQTPWGAREMVRVARALDSLPETAAAFARGEISDSAVRMITQAATRQTEDVLLHFARYGTGRHLANLCGHLRRVLATCAPEEKAREIQRYLRFRYDEDGGLRIYGRFPADEGELIRKAFEAILDGLEESEQPAAGELAESVSQEPEPADPQPDSDPEPEPAVAARVDRDRIDLNDPALQDLDPELVALLLDEDPPDYGPITPIILDDDDEEEWDGRMVSIPLIPERTQYQHRNADALVGLAESFLASPQIRERANHDKYTVVFHIDVASYLGAISDSQAGRCEIARGIGIPVTPDVIHMAACDATLIGMIEDANGNPLYMGRRTRTITPKMRLALNARDKGCIFPECSNTRYLHGHHRQPWNEHGNTDLPDIASLCTAHHRAHHRGEFTITSPQRGVFEFWSPHGWQIGKTPLGTHQTNQQLATQQAGLNIDSQTCRSKWGGEGCDYSVAIHHILVRLGLDDIIPAPPTDGESGPSP